MTTVRDIMTTDAQCVTVDDTLQVAAQRMRDLDVGALPICGPDQKLAGMVTDRDIIVQCVAEGVDTTSTTVERFATGKPITISADDSLETALGAMAENRVRRLPVIDRDRILVGMLAQADVAKSDPARSGQAVAAISDNSDLQRLSTLAGKARRRRGDLAFPAVDRTQGTGEPCQPGGRRISAQTVLPRGPARTPHRVLSPAVTARPRPRSSRSVASRVSGVRPPGR